MSPAASPDATMIRPPRGPVDGSAPGPSSAGGGGGAYSPGPVPSGTGPSAWAASASSQLPGFIERVKNILLTPKTEWPVIEAEPTTIIQLYKGYIIPLAAFSILMSFVRTSIIGYGFFRVSLLMGIVNAVVSFVFAMLGMYIVALIIDALAPTFAGQRDKRQALKTAAYAFTPGAISAVLSLLPFLGVLLQLLAGLYGIYLLYLGLPLLMRSPKDKAGGYTAAVVICTILVGVVFMVLISFTMRMGGYSPYGSSFGSMGMTQEERQAQAAAALGNMIGGAAGTDEKGKADLGAALNNLAAAGAKMEQQQRASANTVAPPVASSGTSADAAAAANTQNAAVATAGLLTALGGAMAGGHRVDPVDFHTLKAMLPDSLPGMQRTNAEGQSQGAIGMKASSATGEYQGQNGARAEIKIVDASAVSGLLNVAGSLAASTNSESDTGYEKDSTISGRTVHEKYDNRSKHGEVTAIVAKRFTVDVTGDGVDMSALEQFASSVDFSKLEAMKDSGAQPQ